MKSMFTNQLGACLYPFNRPCRSATGTPLRRQFHLILIPLTILAVSCSMQAQIAAWDFSSLPGGSGNYGPSPYAATSADPGVTVTGLTRGSGVQTTGSGAPNAWGGNDFEEGSNLGSAIANGNFVTFALTVNPDGALSLSNVDAYNIRRSGSGPVTGQWQYKINNGSFINIGSSINWGDDQTAAGNPQASIDLSGIAALQNLAANSTVTFRIVSWSASGSGGTWYFNDPEDDAAADLTINGSVYNCVGNEPGASAPLTADMCAESGVVIEGNPTGGMAPYTHSWTNLGTGTAFGVSLQDETTEDVTVYAMGAGSIFLRYLVTDAKGCTGAKDVGVTVNALPVGTLTETDASGNSNDDNIICVGASATFTAAEGYLAYSFRVNGASYQSGPGTVFTAPPPSLNDGDDVDVVVMDNIGCTATWTTPTMQVFELPTPGISSQTNVTCFGGSDGSVTVSGGTMYSLDGGPYQMSGTFNGLSEGSYTVTVKNANGCTASQSVTITEPAQLNAFVDFVPVSCNGANDGSILVDNPMGGHGTFEYSIDGGSNWDDSGSFANLAPGMYDVRIRDAAYPTCVVVLDAALNLMEPNDLDANFGYSNVGCYGASNAAIIVTSPTGGYGNYEYTIDGGSNWTNSGSFTGLPPGTYNVQIRDASFTNCVLVLDNSLTITQPGELDAGIAHTDATCFGVADATITISHPTGGTGTYEYSIDGGANWSNSGSFTNLSAGTYNIQIKDGVILLCSVTLDNAYVVNQPAVLNANITPVDATCFGISNGSIAITGATGGHGDFEYSINGGASWQSGGSFPNLPAGFYDVRIRDKDYPSCVVILNPSFAIDQPDELNADVASDNLTCYQSNDGEITLSNPTGGHGDYEYSIDGGSTWQSGGSFTGLLPGTYEVVIRDADYPTCEVTLNGALVISEPPQVSVEPIMGSNFIYLNTNITLTNATPAPMGGSAVWASSNPAVATIDQDGLVLGLSAGMTTITYTVTDANGCNNTASFVMNVGFPFINIGVYNYVAASPVGNKLKIKLKPTVQVINGVYTNGVFTLRTASSNGVSGLSIIGSNPYGYALLSSQLNNGGYDYYVFQFNNDGGYTVNWPANAEFDLLTLKYNCAANATFEIVEDYVYPGPPSLIDGGYYQELNAGAAQNQISPATATSPAAITPLATLVHQTCNALGSISLNVSGGSPSYLYDWMGSPTGDGTANISSLVAGTYTATITDANGCSVTTSPVILYLPVTNTSDVPPTHYATIQQAVNAADPNENIEICAGTYNEAVSVGVAGLTLNGAGAALTIIDDSGTAPASNAGVHVFANNVKVKNLTVTGNPAASVPRYGLKVGVGGVPTDGVILENLKVHNSYRTGFDIARASNLTMTNIMSVNNGGAGIFITNTPGALLTNITTANNPWTGISVATRDDWAGVSDDIVIAGTNSFGESGGKNGGLQLEMTPGKLISWSNNASDNKNVTFQSSDFAYALSGPTVNAPYAPYVRFYQNLTQAHAAADGVGVNKPDHIEANNRYLRDADNSMGLPGTNFYVYDNPDNTMSIQAAVNAAVANNTINVYAGTFNEDVNVTKKLNLLGAGMSSTTVSGPIGGSGATFSIGASGVVIDGFKITRDGNNVTDWNNPNLNTAGVAVQGQTVDVEVRNCELIGNRTAIDINSSNDNFVHNNLIHDNRTGMVFRNQTDNTTVTNNFIKDNWTAGILFLDASGGTNSPLQTALNSYFNNNDISGNWYGQIVDRQTGGSLPAPGSNPKNFECNWYGTTSPVVSTLNSTEPGYATLIPVAYGGSSTPPGGQPDILGAASANFDYVSWLVDDTDTAPANGFQPSLSECSGTPVVITSAVPDPIICNETTGGIQVNFTGGTQPYSVNWTGAGAPVTGLSGSPYMITGLALGTYVVTVTDVNGVTATASAQVLYLPVTNTSGPTYYPTIQAAINAASNGDVLEVCAGTYTELITVNKPLTLRGPQAGQDADARFAAFTGGPGNPKANPALEAIITTPTNNPVGNNPGATDLIRVLSSGVTIDGFVLDGNNPALGASSLTDGAGVNIHARRGITNIDNSNGFNPVSGLLVQYNIIQNVSQRGVSLANNGPLSTGNAVTENVIRHFGYDPTNGGQAVILFTNAYSDVTNNTIEVSPNNIGLHLQNFYTNGSMNWSGNTVTVGAGGIGIHANLFYASSATLNISNNTVNAAAGVASSSDTWGVNVWSVQVGSTVSVSGNTIGSSGGQFSRGVNLWNVPTTNSVTVSNTTVGNSDYGVYASNRDASFGDATSSTSVLNNVDVTSAVTGIYVYDDPANANNATVSLVLNAGNSVTGGVDGLVVENQGASISGGAVSNLAFSGQSGNYIELISNANNLDATAATFGGVTGGAATLTQNFAIEDKILHKIDNEALGFVRVKASEVFVTPASYVGPTPSPSIQRGIDAASAGDMVNVKSGDYGRENALNRSVFGTGSYQFGLYIDKDNLTVKGYDASDLPVGTASDATVTFTTNSTANFGPSGIFVQADGVTLEGMKIGDNFDNSNVLSSNKSIEIVGDDFTMNKCWLNTSADEGVLYMGQWDVSHPIESYSITGNRFTNALVSINNGAGQTGDVSGRTITNNTFEGVITPYVIGLRGWSGANPAQGWIVYPVGGAIITGNTFNNTGVDDYILVRGNPGGYPNSELDWDDIWNLNTYGNHVVTLADYPTFDVRAYDQGGYTESRRISPFIQENVSIGQTGDVVLVSAGTFQEAVTVEKQVTIRGAQYGVLAKGRSGAESIVNPNNSPSNVFTIKTDNVTIDGFTITNTAAYPAPQERYGVLAIDRNGGGDFTGINVRNNIVNRQFKGVNLNHTNNFEISGNWIDGEDDPYNYGCMWVSSYGTSSSNGLITNNDLEGYNSAVEIQGNISQPVSNLMITNNRSTYGQYVFFGLQNSQVKRNTVLNVHAGSHVFIGGGCSNDLFSENFFDNGPSHGVNISNDFGAGINSNLTVTDNHITGHNTAGRYEIRVVPAAYTGTLTATCNWFDATSNVAIAAKLSGPIDFDPWRTTGTDTDGGTPGFQGGACAGTPVVITVDVISPETCTGGTMNGSVTTITSDGAAPYTYLWSNSSTNPAANNLTSGVYTVVVTDANGSTASATATVPALLVSNVTQNTNYATVQAAIAAAAPNDVIELCSKTFNERVVIDKSLTLRGKTNDESLYVLDGTGLPGTGSGILINTGVTNVTIEHLTVQKYAGVNGNSHAGIYGNGSNNMLTVNDVDLKDNTSASGFYANGPVSDVSISNSDVVNNGAGARGIVIWNGAKQNISITGNTVTNNNCCGIELQDGTATDVMISDNVINIGDGDNGIGLLGLSNSTISNNMITGGGRYGIEIKNPAGGVMVSSNTVTLSSENSNQKDRAGIAVFRRSFQDDNPTGYVDVPQGVTISGNTVSGYVQSSSEEGFGIVVEGVSHSIINNIVSGCEVGIQIQGGGHPNANYFPNDIGDGNDAVGASPNYFGRGNAPYVCDITESGNTLSNTINRRLVTAEGVFTDPTGTSTILNQMAREVTLDNGVTQRVYCTIQAAVNAATGSGSEFVKVASGTTQTSYNEQVLVNKDVTVQGVGATLPVVNFTGTPTGKATIFDVSANGVTVDRIQFNTDLTKLSSAIIASAPALDEITVTNNVINPYQSTPGTYLSYSGSYGDRNAISINYGGSVGHYYRTASGGVNSIIVDNNTVSATVNGAILGDDSGDIGFRAASAVDEGAGTYTRNTFQTINHDVLVRFNSNGPITIGGSGPMGNNFNGGGVTIAEHNAGGDDVDISFNNFNGAVTGSVLRLQNNQQNKTTTVANNTFTNLRWGISLENYPNVIIEDNTFSPLAGYTGFRHITVNTKSLSSNSNSIIQVPINGSIRGNTFNSLSPTVGGTALAFYNHDSDNATLVTGAFEVGIMGYENLFQKDFTYAIYFGNQSGTLTTDAPVLSVFPEYNLGGGSATPMACWNLDINIEKNKFDVGSGLQFPENMSGAQLTALESKLFHDKDNACLGELIYFKPVMVNAKVYLQGPYNATTPLPHLMNDQLRQITAGPLFPTADPYQNYSMDISPYWDAFVHVNHTTTETITNPVSVLADNGSNSIVDWVFLELRNPLDYTQVVATRVALLQRDGDIVDLDGTSEVVFPNTYKGSYYLMVRHRNHLGAMTASTVDFTNDAAFIDFSSPSMATFGTTSTSARKFLEPGVYGLIAGNTNMKANTDAFFQVIYTGLENDRQPILLIVGPSSPLNVVPGYYLEDVNLDGNVKYSGADNDRVIILNNVGPTTPLNIVTQQPGN